MQHLHRLHAGRDDYTPKNSTKAQGDLTMIEAARQSTNTYFLQLSQQVGLCHDRQGRGAAWA